MGESVLDFDVVLIGDLRFPGGTSSAMAAEIRALVSAEYNIGIVPVSSKIFGGHRELHSELKELIGGGFVKVIGPDDQVRCSLCILHHPQVFENYPSTPWKIESLARYLVVHHPPIDAAGQHSYDVKKIDRILTETIGQVIWAPVGPQARLSLESLNDLPEVSDFDWIEVIDTEAWRIPRNGPRGLRPIIGRHSRPDPKKWPATRKDFLKVYPDTDYAEILLMGYGEEQELIVGATPKNWKVFPFNSMPAKEFLSKIDFFIYFHNPGWIEAFGRTILEAMAAGTVVILPRSFKSVFGEGAIYCEPEEAYEIATQIYRDPDRFSVQSQAGAEFAEKNFGAKKFLSMTENLIEVVGSEVRLSKPLLAERPKPKVAFFTSNGVGMGHLVRSMAIARRLSSKAEVSIITQSKAFSVAVEAGFRTEYIPSLKASGLSFEEWQVSLEAELAELFSWCQADLVVFDGNVPYEGLIGALSRFPAMWKAWMRRAMWSPNVDEQLLERAAAFDLVIEPAELAELLDRGPTVSRRDQALLVPSIRYVDEAEILDRESARKELSVDKDEIAILLQLGSENNFRQDRVRVEIMAAVQSIPGVRCFNAGWRNRETDGGVSDNITKLDLFPHAKYLSAFDASFAAAGYNTFHENIFAGLPTVFVPNENPEMDEQFRRAQYAVACGLGLIARSGSPAELFNAAKKILNPEFAKSVRERCNLIKMENGADRVAEHLWWQAISRKPLV